MKVIFASLENILANVGEKARGDLHLRLQHILNVIHFKAKGCPLPTKGAHVDNGHWTAIFQLKSKLLIACCYRNFSIIAMSKKVNQQELNLTG